MRAYGYARVSSQEQISGTSLDSQVSTITAYASMRGISLAGVFVDAGVSGGKPLSERPEGARLLASLEPGDAVVTCKLDRAFRSASDCLMNVERWEKTGVGLHILNLGGQTIDTSTPTGKFFITVMAGAAELERNLINERCSEGRKARRAEGKRIGEIPFGYEVAQDGKTLVANATEQEVITTCNQLRARGLTIRAIVAELRAQGIHGRGANWSTSQVHRILRHAA
jgi:DNA invertase Pin-like site-specific DNA recombinase